MFNRLLFFLFIGATKGEGNDKVQDKIDELPEEEDSDVPPTRWQGHWFEHQQLVKRVYYDQHLALYYDDDVDPSVVWPKNYLSEVWKYI